MWTQPFPFLLLFISRRCYFPFSPLPYFFHSSQSRAQVPSSFTKKYPILFIQSENCTSAFRNFNEGEVTTGQETTIAGSPDSPKADDRTVLAPSSDFARGDHVHITASKSTRRGTALLISNAHIIIIIKADNSLYGF